LNKSCVSAVKLGEIGWIQEFKLDLVPIIYHSPAYPLFEKKP